ncbi:uncharacterized protein BHQ10_000793 [Talaromyces amestolkiae]|uniref:Peptidase A1 domain-containing protein n=1 Tax=Talaromyces amestolkiae TaxID=1196081 RepID=A0A364KMM4_TALAM|nr:uncharacterized protein BHQ10_000793 [Talaromyces amestolkiae]RAO64781.1 hypothetical protein BHQ10_000793 [Talaromyces amestolkiae]
MGLMWFFVNLNVATLFSVLVSAVEAQSSTSSQCIPSPIAIAIQNVTVANQPNGAIVRGLNIGVGTPPQKIAFMPGYFDSKFLAASRFANFWGRFFNNSFAYTNNDACIVVGSQYSGNGCITTRGGAYEASQSTSNEPGNTSNFSPDSPRPSPSPVVDTFALNNNTSLSNYTFGVSQDDLGYQLYNPQASLGLDRNSTFLRALKDAGKIGSRSWSFFWGLTAPNNSLDGHIIVGGYDKEKITGNAANYTGTIDYAASSACLSGMVVDITNITILDLNGTVNSLLSNSNTIPACLRPDWPGALNLPWDPLFNKFAELTNYNSALLDLANNTVRAFGSNYYDMRYLSTDIPFGGDLEITLEGGLAIRIPNDQLVVPDQYLDQNGIWQDNSTGPDLLINVETGSYQLTSLNRYFFSAAYLAVNQDAGQFTLWKAHTTPNQNLVGLDEKNQVASAFCSPTPSSIASSSTLAPSPQPNGLSGGSIAGIVVGVIGGVALVSGTGFLFLRYQKKNKIKKQQHTRQVADPSREDKSTTQTLTEGYNHPQHYEMPVGEPPNIAQFELDASPSANR